MTADNFIIDVLAAQVQSESETRSEAIKFGIRHSISSGNVKLNCKGVPLPEYMRFGDEDMMPDVFEEASSGFEMKMC